MDRTDKSLVLFTLTIALIMLLLIAVGESRPDAYIAVAIILYFIYTTIDPALRHRANLRVLDVVLVSIFVLITVIRILMVLNII